MPAYKDKAKGTWYASFYYEDWTGKKVKKMKLELMLKILNLYRKLLIKIGYKFAI